MADGCRFFYSLNTPVIGFFIVKESRESGRQTVFSLHVSRGETHPRSGSSAVFRDYAVIIPYPAPNPALNAFHQRLEQGPAFLQRLKNKLGVSFRYRVDCMIWIPPKQIKDKSIPYSPYTNFILNCKRN